MLEGGNCSQFLCQHHLFSMGHCREVVLARREGCPLSHWTLTRDPRGEVMALLFLCQGAYTTAGMQPASQHQLLGISGSPGGLFRIESYEYTWNIAYRGQLQTDHYSRHGSKRTGKLCPFSSFAKKSNKFSFEVH